MKIYPPLRHISAEIEGGYIFMGVFLAQRDRCRGITVFALEIDTHGLLMIKKFRLRRAKSVKNSLNISISILKKIAARRAAIFFTFSGK